MNFSEVVDRINNLEFNQARIVADILRKQGNLRYRTQGNTTVINPNIIDENTKAALTAYIMSLK